MDKRTENVDHFFEELRRTPAMSVEELESIVAGRESSGDRTRPFVLWGGVALVAVIIAGALLLQDGMNMHPPATVESSPAREIPTVQQTLPMETRATGTSVNSPAHSELVQVYPSGSRGEAKAVRRNSHDGAGDAT